MGEGGSSRALDVCARECTRRLRPWRGKGWEATEARWPQLDYQDRKLGLSAELVPWGVPHLSFEMSSRS